MSTNTDNKGTEKSIKDMSGYLAKNEKTKPTQPDLRGKIRINGKEYLISVWERGEIMSVSITDPDEWNARRSNTPQNSSEASTSTSESSPPKDDFFGDIFP